MSSNLAIPTNQRKTYGFVSLSFLCRLRGGNLDSPIGNRVVCEDLAGENGAFCKILFSKIQFFSKKIHLTFW